MGYFLCMNMLNIKGLFPLVAFLVDTMNMILYVKIFVLINEMACFLENLVCIYMYI